ncbi:MAG: DUF4268 domain-containing protein [Bacteroidetes bacterium]|nr:DUF4268 domain-containing protein [Bacteroidota bacterium]
MHILNKSNNQIEALKKVTFKSLGLKERKDLQEWIAKTPNILGEELLIIQKEFDGFDGTSERLDLLALDKTGNLVIIENKLDSSGKDVIWQALKYASYCSSLTGQNIKDIFREYLNNQGNKENIEDVLIDFFGTEDYDKKLNSGLNQRIIMIAGEFRKEVTSTVVWLLNHGLRVQCFRTSAYHHRDQMFFTFEQILPVKEIEDYIIKMADKQREDINNQEKMSNRHFRRQEFWTQFLIEINKINSFCQNISPSTEQWIPVSLGMGGVSISLVVTQRYARAEVFINRGKEENKRIFDFFITMKEKIESDFGDKLVWERMNDKSTCRIKYEFSNVNAFDSEFWSQINKFLIDATIRMEKAFKRPIEELRNYLSQG